MKLAMAQMAMTDRLEDNFYKSLRMINLAKDSDLIFFPEIQFSPFFPLRPNRQAARYLMDRTHPFIGKMQEKAQEHQMYISPNFYMHDGHNYDTSLLIDPNGEIVGESHMVHIANFPHFYEKEYYTPAPDGFKVFDTPFGKIGIVICFDRHFPESVRSCALRGAQLILIPTANLKEEPMALFEAEIRTQAYQNGVFIAMCNRVGREEDVIFAGESLVAHPNGRIMIKADDREALATVELDLSEATKRQKGVPFLKLRRPQEYEL